MSRKAALPRFTSRLRSRSVAYTLAFAGCLGSQQSLGANGLAEECLIAGRIARVDVSRPVKQVHVEFHDARSTAAAPCRVGTRYTPRLLRFRVIHDSRLESSVPGANIRYRYRRFVDGEAMWDIVAIESRSVR